MIAGALCVNRRSSWSLYFVLVWSDSNQRKAWRNTHHVTDNTLALWILLLENRGLSSRLISMGEVGLIAHILTHLSI